MTESAAEDALSKRIPHRRRRCSIDSPLYTDAQRGGFHVPLTATLHYSLHLRVILSNVVDSCPDCSILNVILQDIVSDEVT